MNTSSPPPARTSPNSPIGRDVVTVGTAGKVGDGVNAFFVYKVTSSADVVVERRYSDFLWLHQQLATHCAGYVIPPLPAKVVGLLQGPEFLEHRRAGLEGFVQKVVAHDALSHATCVRSFLTCSSVELSALKNASSAPAGAASTLSSVVQRTQSLQHWWDKTCQRFVETDPLGLFRAPVDGDGNDRPSTPPHQSIADNGSSSSSSSPAATATSSSSGKDDREFAIARTYVTKLRAQMQSLKRKVRAASQQNQLAAGAHCDLIECLHLVADADAEHAELPTAYYSALIAVLDTRARQMDAELRAFAVTVDDMARWVKAVQNALDVREDRRFVYQAQLAAHRKAVAGDGVDSPSATRLSEALVAAKDEFERVHARVMHEVARFRGQKAIELQKLFLEFAHVQLRNSREFEAVVAQSAVELAHPLPEKLLLAAQTPAAYQSRNSFGLDKDDVAQSTASTQSLSGSSSAATTAAAKPLVERSHVYVQI
ncbi:unnamed protein product [Hyaloperonospora brassicae]|uniref:PX domain-containing protein n=1 Tax=Hyaloperonospora brassicae TaxID=162125 RepID=A0AAV0SXC3_HYABA|nr:unnamed protein product [Hyaloperonospora brassicae]